MKMTYKTYAYLQNLLNIEKERLHSEYVIALQYAAGMSEGPCISKEMKEFWGLK